MWYSVRLPKFLQELWIHLPISILSKLWGRTYWLLKSFLEGDVSRNLDFCRFTHRGKAVIYRVTKNLLWRLGSSVVDTCFFSTANRTFCFSLAPLESVCLQLFSDLRQNGQDPHKIPFSTCLSLAIARLDSQVFLLKLVANRLILEHNSSGDRFKRFTNVVIKASEKRQNKNYFSRLILGFI